MVIDSGAGLPAAAPAAVHRDLRLGGRVFGPNDRVVMAIVNRTPDSFYDKGATYAEDAALGAVERLIAEGADIIDVGGVKAGPGEEVDVAEEIRRTAPFVAKLRARHPELVISVDTWRAAVGRAVCEEGADLLNDSWAGYDPQLAEVAAEYAVGLVCTHSGGLQPRKRPRAGVSFPDVMADILQHTLDLAERTVALGVPRESVLIDPAHDFGKSTVHSLEATRRLDEMVATGWPVLVSLSNKDFIGETLDLPVGERLIGTLAATAVSAWQGARVYRVHQVRETRQVLDMVSSIQGTRAPLLAIRGVVPMPGMG
jgi:dihydropteroate synthase